MPDVMIILAFRKCGMYLFAIQKRGALVRKGKKRWKIQFLILTLKTHHIFMLLKLLCSTRTLPTRIREERLVGYINPRVKLCLRSPAFPPRYADYAFFNRQLLTTSLIHLAFEQMKFSFTIQIVICSLFSRLFSKYVIQDVFDQ